MVVYEITGNKKMKLYEVMMDGSYHETFEKADEKIKELIGTARNNRCVMPAGERKNYIKLVEYEE